MEKKVRKEEWIFHEKLSLKERKEWGNAGNESEISHLEREKEDGNNEHLKKDLIVAEATFEEENKEVSML